MDLEITTPEEVDMNKQNQIGMSSMKAGPGRISAMENMPKKTP
jgi:hypothetical protein